MLWISSLSDNALVSTSPRRASLLVFAAIIVQVRSSLQKSFITSLPDQKVTTKILIAEGDKVAAYAIYSGTLSGPMGEFPATGKSTELNFITIFRIEEGRIAEIWVEWDNLTMLGQLGLFPPPQTQ